MSETTLITMTGNDGMAYPVLHDLAHARHVTAAAQRLFERNPGLRTLTGKIGGVRVRIYRDGEGWLERLSFPRFRWVHSLRKNASRSPD